ncbi:hypothetical protein ACFWC9_40190 [Streptomyces goshikiensis]
MEVLDHAVAVRPTGDTETTPALRLALSEALSPRLTGQARGP